MNGIENKYLWNESLELEKIIINTLSNEDGLTDRELVERLRTKGFTFHVCHYLCLQLAAKDLIIRDKIQGKSLVNRIAKGKEKGLEQIILQVLRDEGDLTDKELAERLKSQGVRPYTCLNLCYQLNLKGLIKRVSVHGKPLVNRIIKEVCPQ